MVSVTSASIVLIGTTALLASRAPATFTPDIASSPSMNQYRNHKSTQRSTLVSTAMVLFARERAAEPIL